MQRIGSALDNMTSGHRGIDAGSAFCWLYRAWALGGDERCLALPAKATVVEVGCGGLHSLGYLCDVAPPGWEIISIDPYMGKGRFAEWVKTAHEKLGDVIDRVKFIRWPSPQACALFADGSLDAVLIDGDHDEGPVLADINGLWPKIKSGGYLAGDDVDPMFPGCEADWVREFPDLTCYGSTALVRKP